MIQKPRKFLGGACLRTPLEPCGARLGNRSVFILDLCPGGYSYTLPLRVCAAHRGRDFEAPDLEWGIHFRGVF